MPSVDLMFLVDPLGAFVIEAPENPCPAFDTYECPSGSGYLDRVMYGWLAKCGDRMFRATSDEGYLGGYALLKTDAGDIVLFS